MATELGGPSAVRTTRTTARGAGAREPSSCRG
jgi:hypothetical protein